MEVFHVTQIVLVPMRVKAFMIKKMSEEPQSVSQYSAYVYIYIYMDMDMYMNIDCCTSFIHFSMSLYWAINSKLLIRCCEAISMFVYFFRLLEDLSGRDGPS